jgi:hypothetical protein
VLDGGAWGSRTGTQARLLFTALPAAVALVAGSDPWAALSMVVPGRLSDVPGSAKGLPPPESCPLKNRASPFILGSSRSHQDQALGSHAPGHLSAG